MPPPKKSPKDSFYDRGQKLLRDAENSNNPALAKLRREAGERYLNAELPVADRMSPTAAAYIFVIYILLATSTTIYIGLTQGKASGLFAFWTAFGFALVLLLFLLAATKLMGQTLVAKLFMKIWEKWIKKLPALDEDD
jgi:uncharacterized RDD family membrane protein YckC